MCVAPQDHILDSTERLSVCIDGIDVVVALESDTEFDLTLIGLLVEDGEDL